MVLLQLCSMFRQFDLVVSPQYHFTLAKTLALTIDSSGTSDITATVQLFCDSNLATEWTSQPVNTPLNLTIPNTLTPSTNCYLTTMPDDFQVPASECKCCPQQSSIEIRSSDSNNLQSNWSNFDWTYRRRNANLGRQNVTVLLNCALPPVNLFIATNTSEITTIDVPQDAKGLVCYWSLPSPQDSISQIRFRSHLHLLESYPLRLSVNHLHWPEFQYNDKSSGSVGPPAMLTLNCGGTPVQTWFNVPWIRLLNWLLIQPCSISRLLLCNLVPDPYVINTQSTPISVEKIPMFINPPWIIKTSQSRILSRSTLPLRQTLQSRIKTNLFDLWRILFWLLISQPIWSKIFHTMPLSTALVQLAFLLFHLPLQLHLTSTFTSNSICCSSRLPTKS